MVIYCVGYNIKRISIRITSIPIRFNKKVCRILFRKSAKLSFYRILFLMLFYPLPCIHEAFDPRSDFVTVTTIFRVVTALPREHRTLQVRHHSQMASVVRADTGNRPGRTVRIGRIAFVVVFKCDMVFFFFIRERELTFTVRNPDT